MTADDLMTKSEQLLDKLEAPFGVAEDRDSIIVQTDDDDVIFVTALEFEFDNGQVVAILNMFLPIYEGVRLEEVDWRAMTELHAGMDFGSLLVNSEDRLIGVGHQAIGWPGDEEFRLALEMLAGSAESTREELANSFTASRAIKYSQLVDD